MKITFKLLCLIVALTLAASFEDDAKPVKPKPKPKPKPNTGIDTDTDDVGVLQNYTLDSGNTYKGLIMPFGFSSTPIYGQLISPGEGSISGFTMDVIVDPEELLEGIMYEMNLTDYSTFGPALYVSDLAFTSSKAQETLTFTFDSPVITKANTVYVIAIRSTGLEAPVLERAYSGFPVTSGDGMVWSNDADISANVWDGQNEIGVSLIHTYNFTGYALPECYCSTCENYNDDWNTYYSYYSPGGDRVRVCTDLSTLDEKSVQDYCSLPDGDCSRLYGTDSDSLLWAGAVGAVAIVSVAAVLMLQVVARNKEAVVGGTGPSHHGLLMEASAHVPDMAVRLEMYSGVPKRAPLAL